MEIQFKETIWSQMEVPEELEAQVVQMIIAGKSPQEVYVFIVDKKPKSTFDYELLLSTATLMNESVHENYPTIDLLNDECESIIPADVTLNPNTKVVAGINKGLERCKGYCPCVPNSIGKEEYKCPCLKFREERECCCNLYVKTYTYKNE